MTAVDVLRTWHDYWVAQQATTRDPEAMDAALSLMVRQMAAVLEKSIESAAIMRRVDGGWVVDARTRQAKTHDL